MRPPVDGWAEFNRHRRLSTTARAIHASEERVRGADISKAAEVEIPISPENGGEKAETRARCWMRLKIGGQGTWVVLGAEGRQNQKSVGVKSHPFLAFGGAQGSPYSRHTRPHLEFTWSQPAAETAGEGCEQL